MPTHRDVQRTGHAEVVGVSTEAGFQRCLHGRDVADEFHVDTHRTVASGGQWHGGQARA
jgi:hypothetical protein